MAKDQISSADYKQSKLDKPIIEPKELEKIKKNMLAPPYMPTSKERGSFVKWEMLQEMVGQPFDTELVPFSKLRQMRNDYIIAMGMYYKKAPLIRARVKMNARDRNGPNPQVAALMHAALMPVYPSLVNTMLNAEDFGFQAMVKEFKFEDPGAFYIDETDPTGGEKPAWQDAKVPPIVYKDFIALPPEKVEPFWNEKTGAFEGIKFEGEAKKKGSAKGPDIGLQHALWYTNEKSKVFGSLYGYPTLAYAFPAWHKFWHLWFMDSRAIERMAVPPLMMKYPKGTFVDQNSELEYDNLDVALEAAAKIRSNGILALPSETHATFDKQSNITKWSAEYLTGGEFTVDMQERLRYLDAAKLRGLMIPEQSIIEGERGGSKNETEGKNDTFEQAQYNKKMEIDAFINKYILPELVARNFPEFVANGGTCKLETTGFDSESTQITKEIVQLLAQSNPEQLKIVDLRAALEASGVPMKSADALKAEVEQGTLTPAVDTSTPAPGSGELGVQATDTGFSYYAPRDVITINLADDSYFEDSAPDTPVFAEANAKYLKQAYAKLKSRYRNQYESFARYVKAQNVQLTTEEIVDGAAQAKAEETVEAWAAAQSEDESAFLKTVAGLVALYLLLRKKGEVDPTDEELARIREEYVDVLRDQIDTTTRDELTTFVRNELERNRTFAEIAAEVKTHFEDFPNWKAMRVVRNEARDLYNESVLDSAEEQGYERVIIHDALQGPTDADCEDRDGEVLTVAEARKIEKLHPHCTLYLEPVKRANFSVEEVDSEFLDSAQSAYFSDADSTLYISEQLSPEERKETVKRAVSHING